jgi:hypothetical protein
MVQIDESSARNDGKVIRAFLKDPLNRKSFDAFYKLCYQVTIGYLRYLQGRGYPIPIEKHQAENPLSDVAIDLLGSLLQSRTDEPFFVIYDYYKRHGIKEYESAGSKELAWHMTVLVRGHAKKEMSKIRKEADPQIDNLKKRFKDILRGHGYGAFTGSDERTEFVFWKEYENDLRQDKPPVSHELLKDIVGRAYAECKDRTEWCRLIFEMLNQEKEYQNFIRRQDLITAVIAINAEHVELYGSKPTRFPSPEMALIDDQLEEARKTALEIAKQDTIKKFLNKGRITSDESDRFLTAVEHYLTDLGQNGNPDSIPEYFRLVMPPDVHSLYLNKYKHVFETVINRAVEEFRNYLKE